MNFYVITSPQILISDNIPPPQDSLVRHSATLSKTTFSRSWKPSFRVIYIVTLSSASFMAEHATDCPPFLLEAYSAKPSRNFLFNASCPHCDIGWGRFVSTLPESLSSSECSTDRSSSRYEAGSACPLLRSARRFPKAVKWCLLRPWRLQTKSSTIAIGWSKFGMTEETWYCDIALTCHESLPVVGNVSQHMQLAHQAYFR